MSNYKYGFFDNQLIGVDHLNEITSRLVSGGISAVYSGADFNVSDINNSNMAALTGGVVPESESSLKVTAIGDGRYLINPGLCFFDDGTSMEVLSGGEEFAVSEGTKRHIYLTSDQNLMECYVEVLENEKQSGQFVYLAIVSEDGTITDKRTYARGKLPGFYSSSEGLEVNITQTFEEGVLSGTLEIPVGEGNFKHLCITGGGLIFYCEFEDGISKNYDGINGDLFWIVHDADDNVGHIKCYKNVKIENGKLIISVNSGVIKKGKSVTVCYHLW